MGHENDRTILLVEDEALIAMAEQQTLERHGYGVVPASTGEKAVKIATERPEIDLVLMDINLGRGIDGTEAAAVILEIRDLPIVFLSSHTDPTIVEKTERITSYGYIVKDSGETVLTTSLKMAFRLFESRKLATDTFDHSINGLCVHRLLYDETGRPYDCEYLKVNEAFQRQTGLAAQQVIGKTVRALYPNDEAREVMELYVDVVTSGTPVRKEIWFAPMASWYELSVFPTGRDEFTVVVENVTERKRAEQQLREERAELATITELSPIGITTVDAGGVITYANSAAERILGLHRDEITARTYDAPQWEHTAPDGGPFPDDHQPFTIVKTTLQPTYDVRHGITWPDGRHVELSINASPILDDDRSFHGMVATIEDITERKRTEDQVHMLLREKETLLRESHHRVTNNMNTLHSLLSLQSNATDSPIARDALNDAANRLQAMARLYDRLFRDPLSGPMSIRRFLLPLVEEGVEILAPLVPVRMSTEVEDVLVDPRTLTTIGISVNELVTNSVKHAFAGKEEGHISVAAVHRDSQITVTYRDDGPGLSRDAAEGVTAGFGMRLVEMMLQNLGGQVRVHPGHALHIDLVVPTS